MNIGERAQAQKFGLIQYYRRNFSAHAWRERVSSFHRKPTITTVPLPFSRSISFQMAPQSTRGLTTVIGASTVFILYFVYSRSSVQAAKSDAARQRAADGGQISWRNESLRRHGVMERPDGSTPLGILFSTHKPEDAKVPVIKSPISKEEKALRAAKRKEADTER